MIESERLNFIRYNQSKLRADLYKNVNDAFHRGETEACVTGKRIIIPSSFTGGPRYMAENCKDAFAICRWAGYPSLFITITCNPKWPEIIRFTKDRGLRPEDRPDILCRVFKIKLDQFMNDLTKGHALGRVNAYVCTVEFQKRGLPHAHILLFLHQHDKPSTAADIDSLISAEIPNPNDNPALHEVVNNFMIHGPCGVANLKSPCMHGGKCSKRFPKKFLPGTTIDEEGFPHYKRRDDGITVNKKRVHLDSRYVVPYNAKLLLKYQAHINVEYTCQSSAIKYLFKYIHKGNDRVTATFHHSPTNSQTTSSTDEIKMFYDCRYISSCEAVWRILGFDIHSRYPPVQRLPFHLPDQKSVVFKDDSSISEVMTNAMEKKSMFEAWMEANNKYEEGRDLTYPEFPTKFVYQENNREWHPRKKGFSIGRLSHVPPKNGDDYYLRMLLNTQKGSKNYEDLRTVNGVIFPTFKDACYSLGFLEDDKEYIDAIKEASFWASGHYLRRLFALMLFCNNMSRPKYVWEQCWKLLSDDILYQQRKNMNRQDLVMTDEQIKNVCLAEIESCLQSNGKSLCNYPTMPCPTGESVLHVTNKLILDELSYDRSLLAKEHQHLLASLTEEQSNVYHRIMEATSANKGGFFFLYGFGGTGKTFIWKTLSAAFRSIGEIVLNVASSGIASLLLPGGRTAHSRMCIPIDINEDSTCNIKQNSPQAELLSRAKLIIWDEAPMVHKFCFEALDRTLRDILRFSNRKSFELPFGGKVVVLGGDFRQILPVIPHGGRQEIVHATINSSHLWHYCEMLTLTRNMRLCSQGTNNDVIEIKMFSEWLLDVGDGKVGDNVDGYSTIKIPDEILINDCNDPISALVEFAYPNLLKNMLNPSFFQERAILAPTLADVSMLNEYLMSKISEEEKVYLSLDSICKAEGNNNVEEDAFPPEILNTFSGTGLPNHKLTLKKGVPVMLLRNIDQSRGLCNGTRLITTKLGEHVIEGKVVSGNNIGEMVLIPRMNLSPSNNAFPVKFERRQFPLAVSFAMTINKSQGQTLSHVGIYLPRPVFTHGQLYVALSRVKSKKGLKLLILDENGSVANNTTNIVFREIFQRLT